MQTMTTLCFKDVFVNGYEDFKVFTDDIGLYNAEDIVAEEFNKHLYYTLYNRYVGVDLAYDTVDLFLAEFGIAYQQYFKQFLIKKKLTEELYKLDLKDFEILTESIANFSNNPNYVNTDAWETLKYISQQQRGRAKAGKLTAYINAIRVMPDAQIDAMLKQFDYLWLDILPTDLVYLY